MTRLIMVLLCIIITSACNLKDPLPIPSEESYDCRRVKVADGPEDFVLDQWHSSPRLLISSHDRRHPEKAGGIYFFQINTEQSGEMRRVGDPSKITAFKPHGVDIRHSGSETFLYVIIHDPYGHMKRSENAVVVYLVEENDLKFVNLLEDKRCLWSPNDLSVLPSGEIYLTNDYRGNLDLYFRKKVSEIAYFYPETDKWSIVADRIAFANGILAEENHVYVAATLGEQILEYPRNEDGSLGEGRIFLPFKGPDNLTKQGKYLLTAAHFDDMALMKHKKDPSALSPSVVFRIDPVLQSKTTVFVDSGALISAASTAMIYKNKLYISEAFDPYIVICRVPKYLFLD